MRKDALFVGLLAQFWVGLILGSTSVQGETFAYVADFVSNEVFVVDTATNIVVAEVPVGSGPASIAITPDGAFVYVANSQVGSVSVIDTSTNTVVATVPVGGIVTGVATTPDGTFAYVTSFSPFLDSVTVIDTSTNTVVATVPVSNDPAGIAITPDGAFAYVTIRGPIPSLSNVTVIDTSTNTVVATIPFGFGFSPGGHRHHARWSFCLRQFGRWFRLSGCDRHLRQRSGDDRSGDGHQRE